MHAHAHVYTHAVVRTNMHTCIQVTKSSRPPAAAQNPEVRASTGEQEHAHAARRWVKEECRRLGFEVGPYSGWQTDKTLQCVMSLLGEAS